MLGRSVTGVTREGGNTSPQDTFTGIDRLQQSDRLKPQQAVIGKDCRVTGKLELSGISQIDGAVSGEVVSTGDLTIGEGASIEARITGNRVRVFGNVTGDIDCSERLELHAGARVIGSITSKSLVIHDGVFFEGQCVMRKQNS